MAHSDYHVFQRLDGRKPVYVAARTSQQVASYVAQPKLWKRVAIMPTIDDAATWMRERTGEQARMGRYEV